MLFQKICKQFKNKSIEIKNDKDGNLAFHQQKIGK